MVSSYAERYPSVLPGGALEGPLPAGPDDPDPTKAKDEKQPLRSRTTRSPIIDKYDPKKTKIPANKKDE